MFTFNGRNTASLVEHIFITSLIFGFVILAFSIGRFSGVNDGRREIGLQAHNFDAAYGAVAACDNLAPNAKVTCIRLALDAATKESPSEQDRLTQQDMSKWAFWTMLLTGASVFVTASGLYYVSMSLKANHESIKLSQQEFLATHRPKIRLNTCIFDIFGAGIPLTLKITQINVGDSDARVFNHNIGLIYRESGKQNDYEILAGDDEEPLPAGVELRFEIDTEIVLSTLQFASVLTGEAELFIDMTTHFRDGNGTMRFTSAIRKYHLGRRRFLPVPLDHEFSKEDFEG